MRAWPLLLLLTACDPSGGRVETGRRQAALDAELANRRAGPTTACIDMGPGGGAFDVIDGRTLVHRTARTIYVNRLEAACPGLRATSRVLIEPSEPGRACRLDRIRALDEGSSSAGAICPLGRFTPYTLP